MLDYSQTAFRDFLDDGSRRTGIDRSGKVALHIAKMQLCAATNANQITLDHSAAAIVAADKGTVFLKCQYRGSRHHAALGCRGDAEATALERRHFAQSRIKAPGCRC